MKRVDVRRSKWARLNTLKGKELEVFKMFLEQDLVVHELIIVADCWISLLQGRTSIHIQTANPSNTSWWISDMSCLSINVYADFLKWCQDNPCQNSMNCPFTILYQELPPLWGGAGLVDTWLYITLLSINSLYYTTANKNFQQTRAVLSNLRKITLSNQSVSAKWFWRGSLVVYPPWN